MSKKVTFTTCDGPHEYDARMYVFDDADCNGGRPKCVEGNADGEDEERCDLMSEIIVHPSKGGAAGRYYVFVGGFWTHAGEFRLDVHCW